jgi:hypothetical protein
VTGDSGVAGQASLADVLRYYLRHSGILFYFIPNVVLLLWLLLVPTPSHSIWFVAGLLAFLPQEYLTHVYILHFKAPKSPTAFKLLYRAHYGHHEFPKRIDLMWIPLWLTLPLLAVNLAVISPLAGTLGNTLGFLCGLMTSYLLFEWSHLLCHVPLRLRRGWLSSMRKRHLLHHYRNEHYWYSVQQPSWVFDSVGGTAGTPETVPSSGTSLSLGVDHQDPRAHAAREAFARRSTGDLERSRIWQ